MLPNFSKYFHKAYDLRDHERETVNGFRKLSKSNGFTAETIALPLVILTRKTHL